MTALFRPLSRPIPATRNAQNIVQELTTLLRGSIKDLGLLTWSINVGDMPDSELTHVVAALRREGYKVIVERDLGFVAHFTVTWRSQQPSTAQRSAQSNS